MRRKFQPFKASRESDKLDARAEDLRIESRNSKTQEDSEMRESAAEAVQRMADARRRLNQ